MRQWVQWRWGEVWWVVSVLREARSQGSLDPKSDLERIDRYS